MKPALWKREMQREFLSSMPALAFLILFVFAMSSLTSVLFFLIKKFFPHSFHQQKDKFLFVLIEAIGINYAVLLGFVVITLWTAFDNLKKVTAMEANHLSLMTVDCSTFPSPIRDDLLNLIGQYIHNVIDDEWETMKQGKQSQKAFDSYSTLIKHFQAYIPQTEAEKAFYNRFMKNLHDAYENRRLRIASLNSSLIPSLLFILIFDALLILILVTLIDNKKYKIHFFLTLALGWILFFNIGLVLLFEYPFSASLVSYEAFTEGFLARFNN